MTDPKLEVVLNGQVVKVNAGSTLRVVTFNLSKVGAALLSVPNVQSIPEVFHIASRESAPEPRRVNAR